MRRRPPRSTLVPDTTLVRSYACRAAVKAGERLDQREMRELLLRLFATDLPPHDVHGRATIVQLPREELRSEEHTLNFSHANISYAVFCLKKNNHLLSGCTLQ